MKTQAYLLVFGNSIWIFALQVVNDTNSAMCISIVWIFDQCDIETP